MDGLLFYQSTEFYSRSIAPESFMMMNIESGYQIRTTLQCELIRNTHRAVHPRGHPNSGAGDHVFPSVLVSISSVCV